MRLRDIYKLPKNRDVFTDFIYTNLFFNKSEMEIIKSKIVKDLLNNDPKEFNNLRDYIESNISSEFLFSDLSLKVYELLERKGEGKIEKIVAFIELYHTIFSSNPDKDTHIIHNNVMERLIDLAARRLEGYNRKLFVRYYGDLLLEIEQHCSDDL